MKKKIVLTPVTNKPARALTDGRVYHFISGFPRAGSSLLAAILNQNPRFSAGIRSPLQDICLKMTRAGSSEFQSFLPQEKTAKLCRGLFDNYHDDKPVVFDTNRAWLLNDSLLKTLYPEHKMILCVRSIIDVLNSFEHIHKKNPLLLTGMYPEEYGKTVFSRCGAMMAAGGPVFEPWQAMREYLATTENPPLIIEYESLAKNPAGTMKLLYDHIGEEYFQHDFNDCGSSADEYDMLLRTPGLHTTRSKVEYIEEKMLLPEMVVKQFKNPDNVYEFWRA